MKAHGEIRQMIDEFWRLPVGPGRITVAEEAVGYADAVNDSDLSFAARLAMIDACSGSTRAYRRDADQKVLVAFSWCLSEYKRDPSRRTAWDIYALRWFFKNVVVVMRDNPAMPLDRIYAVLYDMKEFYQANGQSLHTVQQYRWELEEQVGNLVEQDRLFDEWVTAVRDENSTCDHWDRVLQVTHLAGRGRDAEAVTLALPALGGEVGCTSSCYLVPEDLQFLARADVLAEAMVSFLRTGRLSDAAHAHQVAYRGLSRACEKNRVNSVRRIGDIARHIHFCGITGNESRGLEIIERHLDSLEKPQQPEGEMLFAAAAALVLRRTADLGHSEIRVGSATVGTAALGERLAERATEIAARFDVRNGTAHQGDRVTAWLTAEPLVDHLPLPSVEIRPFPEATRMKETRMKEATAYERGDRA